MVIIICWVARTTRHRVVVRRVWQLYSTPVLLPDIELSTSASSDSLSSTLPALTEHECRIGYVTRWFMTYIVLYSSSSTAHVMKRLKSTVSYTYLRSVFTLPRQINLWALLYTADPCFTLLFVLCMVFHGDHERIQDMVPWVRKRKVLKSIVYDKQRKIWLF